MPWTSARWCSTGRSKPLPFHETSCGVYFSMPSKKRFTISRSESCAEPSDQIFTPSSLRSAHEIAATRCTCGGRKSFPVAWRRRCVASSTTALSLTPASSSQSLRSPSASGTVSMSKTRIGVMASCGEHSRGQIAVAAIAHDVHDDRLAKLRGHAHRRREATARRDAREDAFLARQPPRHLLAFLLRDLDYAIHARALEDLRQVFLGPLANARHLRPGPRLHADHLDRRILLLEKTRASHDRSRGSHRRDELRDRAARVAPDRGRGAGVVRQRIVRIGELVEDQALSCFAHALGGVARELHAAFLRREDELRAEGGHRLPPLDRQVLGHHQHHAIAAHRGDHREGDAGVAAGRLDQSRTRADQPALLRSDDHRKRRAVLHRARRVVALELRQHHVGGLPRNALQAHERRIADELIESGVHARRDGSRGRKKSPALGGASLRSEEGILLLLLVRLLFLLLGLLFLLLGLLFLLVGGGLLAGGGFLVGRGLLLGGGLLRRGLLLRNGLLLVGFLLSGRLLGSGLLLRRPRCSL